MYRRFQRAGCLLLVLLLLSTSLSACAGSSAAPQTGPVVEDNTGRDRALYPYVVHTPSATWYLAAKDIELLGEDAYYEGLYALLENQEQDFADAREVLKGYVPEEIPPVDIYTDFCGDAAIAETAGAYYNRSGNFIKLFSGWDLAKTSLLHEYVHYLSFHCAAQPITSGLYAEGLAEYVADIACVNRMSRSFHTASAYSEEEIAFMRSHGFWDEEEACVDLQKYYYGYAAQIAQGILVGDTYFSVRDITEERTEEIQQDPTIWDVSHYEAACILAYLIDTHSRDTVFRNLSTSPDDYEAVFGEPFSETYQKWVAWDAEMCAELGVG